MNFSHNDLQNQIDSTFLGIVKAIDQETDSNYFLIGATARDFTFHNIYGLELSERATADVDIAVCVKNWDQYIDLKRRLMVNHKFIDDPEQIQRVLSYDGTPIDLIPFGNVAVDSFISWPESDNVMSVACYENAREVCNSIQYPDFSLNLVSIELFISLKLVAWDSRNALKDLKDIIYVIDNYHLVPNIENQINELGLDQRFIDILDMSAAALAFNMKQTLDANSYKTVTSILDSGLNRVNRMPLVRKMQSALPPHSFPGTLKFLEMFYTELKS
ncbi:MAG: hypothetical protein NE327_18610 [Lentisphaeraceae bacterium]|nr:hypothetical protein [Lentisphaeraceae bacterium]